MNMQQSHSMSLPDTSSAINGNDGSSPYVLTKLTLEHQINLPHPQSYSRRYSPKTLSKILSSQVSSFLRFLHSCSGSLDSRYFWYFLLTSGLLIPKNLFQQNPSEDNSTSSPTGLLTRCLQTGEGCWDAVVGDFFPRRLWNFTAVFMRFKRMVSGSLKGDHPTTNSQEKWKTCTQLDLVVIE